MNNNINCPMCDELIIPNYTLLELDEDQYRYYCKNATQPLGPHFVYNLKFKNNILIKTFYFLSIGNLFIKFSKEKEVCKTNLYINNNHDFTSLDHKQFTLNQAADYLKLMSLLQ